MHFMKIYVKKWLRIILPNKFKVPANVAAGRENVISQTVRNESGTSNAPIIAQPYGNIYLYIF